MHRSPQSDERIFADALDLPAGERARFLHAACEGDNDRRKQIEALLEAHELAENFMAVPRVVLPPEAADLLADPLPLAEDKIESKIGRYKLLQKIGEGGCGVVYMAEQEKPVRRRVALKVIKLGMDTKAVIARFEAERQALAMMDHPNIARVLDAGATETGRPYFVMELVRGVRITEFCDQRQLSAVQRLKLFTQVCLGVQHAHHKGIIHRDLKPANILVTINDGLPVPKIIDFGIAKATQGRLTDCTVFTAFEQFIGTPAYMSPEQAEMSSLDVDTRSDIYSLGVLLYELLTGRQPFDAQTLREAGIDEIRRLIREVEPPKPSTRLGTLSETDRTTAAKLRGTDVPKLSLLLCGDIDWIVMKALDKNRERRYETASALAADISRHLRHEPVLARPPSMAYLLQKLIRRNRLAFAAVAVTTALGIGLGVATWLFTQEKVARERAVAAEQEQHRAREQAEAARFKEAQQRLLAQAEEAKARAAAAKSEQAFTFIAGFLKGVGPGMGAGLDTTLLHEILDRTVNRLDTMLPIQPEADANLRFILGTVFVDLGDYAKAEAMARQALALAEKLHGREHEDVAGALVLLGQIQQLQGRAAESEPLVREALAIARKIPGAQGENLAGALIALGNSLLGQGKLTEAERYCHEALTLVQLHPDIDYLPPDMVQMILAAVLQKQGRLAEAEPVFNEALDAQKNRNSLGQDHPMVLFARLGLSHLLMMQSKLPEARMQFYDALATLRRSHNHEYPTIVMVLFNLAYIAHQSGRLADAEIQYREVLSLQKKVLGPEHPATMQTEALLAQVRLQQKSDGTEPRPPAIGADRNPTAKP
jgi:serine/threonine protein kinase